MLDNRNFQFRLFIAGESANSIQAIGNLAAFCREYLAGRHEIEIVDVLREPIRGLDANILLTPTLLKVSPPPARRLIGNLGNTRALLYALKIELPGR